MKKGIVMEKHPQYTIVMEKGGSFYKAKPVNAMIGTEVSFEPYNNKKKTFLLFPAKKVSVPVRLLSMACVLLLLVLPFYFVMSTNKTYAYVNIDINPSIELELNKDLKVQSIHSLNKDAKELVTNLSDYKHQDVEKVIRLIMKESEQSGLINAKKNILVGVSYADGEFKDISVLEQVDSAFQKNSTDWSVVTFNVPKNIRDEAKENNKSMNEMMAGLVNKDNKILNDSMNDQERAIVNSFYTDKKDHSNREKEQDSHKIKEKNNESTTTPVPQNKPIKNESNKNNQKEHVNHIDKQQAEKEKNKNSNNGNIKNENAQKNIQKAQNEKSNNGLKKGHNKEHNGKDNHSHHNKKDHHFNNNNNNGHRDKYNKNDRYERDGEDDDRDDEDDEDDDDHDDDDDDDEDEDEDD